MGWVGGRLGSSLLRVREEPRQGVGEGAPGEVAGTHGLVLPCDRSGGKLCVRHPDSISQTLSNRLL